MNSTPVGLSRDLPAKRVMRAEVDGQDVAVWRDPEGDLHAWNNRCPHRGMRLSHGFVRGDKLACLYHGWHYARDGACAYIPAHPDLEPPATITAQVYHVAEASGVIWVATTTQPDMPQPRQAMVPLRSLAVSCAPERALAAFAATPFRGAVPEETAEGEVRLGDRLVSLCASTLGADVTLIHARVDAGARLPDLRALSRWCEAARHTAEADAA
ncbi:MAG: Rieske (2Fe-2S) protein [Pseudomonadota bacterium]